MANIDLVTDNRIRVVESFVQMTLPAGEDLTAGQVVRIHPDTGRFVKAGAASSTTAFAYGIVVRSVAAGMPVTAIRHGVLDGFDLDDLDYNNPVFLSDTAGALADATGTETVVLGRVIPGTATTLGTAYDKMLYVEPATSVTLVQAPANGGDGDGA